MAWLVDSALHFRMAEAQYGTKEKLGHLSAPGRLVEILDQFFHHALVLQFRPSLVVSAVGSIDGRNVAVRYRAAIQSTSTFSTFAGALTREKGYRAPNAVPGVD